MIMVFFDEFVVDWLALFARKVDELGIDVGKVDGEVGNIFKGSNESNTSCDGTTDGITIGDIDEGASDGLLEGNFDGNLDKGAFVGTTLGE